MITIYLYTIMAHKASSSQWRKCCWKQFRKMSFSKTSKTNESEESVQLLDDFIAMAIFMRFTAKPSWQVETLFSNHTASNWHIRKEFILFKYIRDFLNYLRATVPFALMKSYIFGKKKMNIQSSRLFEQNHRVHHSIWTAPEMCSS